MSGRARCAGFGVSRLCRCAADFCQSFGARTVGSSLYVVRPLKSWPPISQYGTDGLRSGRAQVAEVSDGADHRPGSEDREGTRRCPPGPSVPAAAERAGQPADRIREKRRVVELDDVAPGLGTGRRQSAGADGDDERDVGRPARREWRDPAALTAAEQADPGGVNVVAGSQQLDRGEGVNTLLFMTDLPFGDPHQPWWDGGMATLAELGPKAGELGGIEVASRDEVEAVQLDRLRRSLRHAYEHVPFYRASFEGAGVHPDDLRELADLARFPVTSKQDLRAHYPYGMFAVPREEVVRIHASSGTTGQPTVVGYTRADIDTWAELMARSIRAAGGRAGMIAHVAYGYGLFTGGLGAHYGAERLGCTVIPMSGGMTERQARLIVDLRPDIILVTPSYLLTIVDELERQGVDPAGTSLKVGILGAEPWTPDMRREIEDRTGMHAVDIYGLSEVMGPGVAVECVETKDGLHIWEDHFRPEIVDPTTGEVLPDGERGELVLTSLTKQALPVIRYRTRDLTRLLPGTARPGFRRMEKVTGRSDDMMIVRGVNLFPTQIEELILGLPGLAPHFQCVLSRPARLDELEVRAESRTALSAQDSQALATELARRAKETIGVSVMVTVLPPGSVERSTGKMRRIIDNRG
jgi:phenylacetate-CoA ligase